MTTLRLHPAPSSSSTADLDHTPTTVLSMSGSEHIASVPPLTIAHSSNGLTTGHDGVNISAPRPATIDSEPPSPSSTYRSSSQLSSGPPSPATGSLHVSTSEPIPAAVPERSVDPTAALASNIAASSASPLPPLSTTRDKLMFVWRLIDQYDLFIRPLLFPIIAWGLGALHVNIVVPIALALFWFYSLKNGHLLPRPPPSAAQLKAEADRLASEGASPTSPQGSGSSEVHMPLSFQMDDRNVVAGATSSSLLSRLPAMLSGLTVQYPMWVFYPDVQRTKWINDILEHLWPYAKAAVKAEFDKLAGPHLAKLGGYVVVAELDLGPDAPFVGGIKTYDTKSEDSVMLDIDICVSIEPSIRVEARWRSFVFPVRVLSVSAAITARVTLTDLVGKFPCFRSLGISLAGKPQIQTIVDIMGFNFFDVPILGSYAQHMVEDVVMGLFGWPKQLSIPVMVETAEESAARNKKEPKGLLHVFLMSATNLRNADVALLMGKSDPYCKLSLGQQKQTSQVIHDNLNPTWNADFEFICYEPELETLTLELYDSEHIRVPNPLNSKKLGDVSFAVGSLLQSGFQDVTLPLQHTTKGVIRFQAEWRPFKPRSSHHHSAAVGEGFSASNSVLFVSSLRALDLPVDSCQLKFSCNNASKKTELIDARGRECQWEESFSFPVHNPDVDVLTVQLRYDDHLGKLTGFATKTATLGLAKVKTKAAKLAEFTVDMREVARTGQLQDDFLIPMPPGMKVQGRPKLHMSLMLRELAASKGHKERKLAASRAAVPGTLRVTLVKASNLISDAFGKASDPYVVVTVGAHHQTSATKKRTIDPEWRETYKFKVSDLLRDDLQFDVRDHGVLGNVPGVGGMMSGFIHKVTHTNDHLGDAHIPLRVLYGQLCGGALVQRELPLHHTKRGTITIELQFEPDEGVVMPPASLVSQSSLMDLKQLGSSSSLQGLPGASVVLSSQSSQSSQSSLQSVSETDSRLGEPHVTADGYKTDATGVTPMVHGAIEHASMGVAAGLHTGEQLQRVQEEKDAASSHHTSHTASVSSLPSSLGSSVAHSAPSSDPTTPVRSLHSSVDLTHSPPDQQASPTHSRQHSQPGVIETDHIHQDMRTLEGYLVVTIHQALRLPPQHKDGSVSAYVKLTLGRTKVHTNVCTAVDPTWEAVVRLPLHTADVVHPQATVLKVRVKRYKRGNLFGNEVVGDADVPLSHLIDSKVGSEQFHVGNVRMEHGHVTLVDHKTNAEQGSVVLSCHFEPKPTTTPPMLAANDGQVSFLGNNFA